MANLKIDKNEAVDKLGYVQSHLIGSIVIIFSTTIPDGWLLCDGRPVNTADYPELSSVIGTTYGSGSGTFNLPPLVYNAAYNPTPRYAMSTVASEPTYPSSFSHKHNISLANTSVTMTSAGYTHSHVSNNSTSAVELTRHNHTAWNANAQAVNNASGSGTNRSAASGTPQYHSNTHAHGNNQLSLSTNYPNVNVANNINGGNNPTYSDWNHSHDMQVHGGGIGINHTHTTNVTSPVLSESETATGGANAQLPLSKYAYFIIKC
jgi:microcystin-dependent protein